MIDPHDLILKFKFTDRGGRKVYDVMRCNLSAGDLTGDSGAPAEEKIGQMRFIPGGSDVTVEWSDLP